MGQGTTKGVPIDTDSTMAANSDALVASQKAVKTALNLKENIVTAASLGTIVNGSSTATPNDTDLVTTVESSVVKKITWTNVKAFLKTYFDTLYQVVLTSGTNIKTINGNSLLGSGDISISGSTLADGDYGDITVGGSGTTMTIDNSVVGVSKLSATGTPSATTFLRGDNTWGAPTNPEGWTTIVKSANQDVTNSATLVNDTDLQFSVVAGGHYMIELDAVISSSSTTGDYKNAFNVSAGTMKAHGLLLGTTATGNAAIVLYNANAAATSTAVGIGTIMNDLDGLFSIKIIYSFTASANATFRYQFAQNTATLATTARTWKGSILKYKRID